MKQITSAKMAVLYGIIACVISSNLFAGAFLQSTASSLVVVRLGDWQTSLYSQNAPIFLDEYDVSEPNAVLVNTVAMPSSGPECVTLTLSSADHDGHLHISTNKQYLTLAGYRNEASSDIDPSAEAAIDYPRVICRVDMAGSYDLSTVLHNTCDYGAIRGAITDDGTRFWTAGDNASGANNGGLHFALIGAAYSTNISHNQVAGSSGPTTDNPRDVNIADNQLYVGAGSDASIGKTLAKTNVPLPTSGNQNYIKIYTQSAAASNFMFLDLSPVIPGTDTVYTTSTNPVANSVRKYSKTFVNGSETWVFNGYLYHPYVSDVVAAVSSGRVVVFFTTPKGIFRYVDTTGYNGAISGNFSSASPYIPAAGNTQFRGIEILPLRGDFNLDSVVNLTDFAVLAGNWLTAGEKSWNNGDVNGDKNVDSSDLMILAANWLKQAQM